MRLSDGEIHRKHRPILAPPDDLAADPHDLLAAGAQIIREIRVMLPRVGLRHQDLDVASDQCAGRIAEELLGRLVDRADRAVAVDDHNGIDGGVDDRAIEGVGKTPAIIVLPARCCRTQLPDP